jgi:aspartate/methionine/tyrosine aminotransferase
MGNIKDKMRPVFADLDGGLFSVTEKADVGDVAERMKKMGVDMMSWADPFAPDPSIPEHVLNAAMDALKGGFPAHYIMPIGSPDLKELIAKRTRKIYGIDLDPQRNILINPGSDLGLLFAMFPWINPGDEVMVHDPSYGSNFLNSELLGGKTVRVPTYEEDGWHIRIEEYEKRLTDKTKMVLLTNPNNPTCVSYTRKEMEELAEFCIKNDLICVCDQAFEDTVFDGHEMVCMAQIPGMWERTVTVCSVSKGMALSGFRVGWIYANDVIMNVLYGSAVNIQGATSTLSQMAVMPAFENDSFIQEYRQKYDNRRKFAYKLFNSIPGVTMLMPESSFMLWINVSRLGTSTEVTNYLIKEAKVCVNDGKFYGDQGNGYIRLVAGCYWKDEDSFDAMNRMAEAFKKLAISKGLTE